MQSNLTCKNMVARHLSTNLVLLVNETPKAQITCIQMESIQFVHRCLSINLESDKEEFSA